MKILEITIISNNKFRAPAAKEAADLGKEDASSLQNRTHSESASRSLFQGFLSKVPLRVRFVEPKPGLTLADIQRKCREEYHRQEARRLAGDIDPALLNTRPIDLDQIFDDLAKTYHYRRPRFPQVRDRRKHPILAGLFWFFLNLQWSFDPPWKHIRVIIANKKPEMEGGAA